jgi:hypothetical protein
MIMVDYYLKNYLVKPETLPLVTSKRQGKNYGSMGIPNALVKDYSVTDLHRVFGQDVSGKQMNGYRWKTKIILWFPEILPALEDLGRLSNLATWDASNNELWRIGLDQKKFWDSPNFQIVRDIVMSYEDKIIDACIAHDKLLYDEGGDFEQFKRYVRDPKHAKSSVPGMKGKKWLEITEAQLKLKFKELRGFQKYKVANPDKYYRTGFIISDDYKVDALRYRIAKLLNMAVKDRNTVFCAFKALRMRTAKGTWPDSQMGYVYWKKPELKKKVMQPLRDVLTDIGAGLIIKTFSEEKTQLYLDIANADAVTYADLTSGETQWGNTLGTMIPLASSIFDHQLEPIRLKGDSGRELTPWFNEVLNVAHGRMFLEKGILAPGDVYAVGSDNTAIFKDLTEDFQVHRLETLPKGKDVIGGLSQDERFLGWKARSHWPLNLIKDDARHNLLWNGDGNIRMTMKYGRLEDLISLVISMIFSKLTQRSSYMKRYL